MRAGNEISRSKFQRISNLPLGANKTEGTGATKTALTSRIHYVRDAENKIHRLDYGTSAIGLGSSADQEPPRGGRRSFPR